MKYTELDMPALLIDNLRHMQDYADKHCVFLRPHTKTHKMPAIAHLQIQEGARGIAVAKAEVMAEQGISDILVANEIVGQRKLERIRELSKNAKVTFRRTSLMKSPFSAGER